MYIYIYIYIFLYSCFILDIATSCSTLRDMSCVLNFMNEDQTTGTRTGRLKIIQIDCHRFVTEW